MSLHTASLISEKRFSCPPAAVHFAGVEKGIDMKETNPKMEFAVGDCGAVYLSSKDEISISFLAWQCDVDDIPMHKLSENAEIVDIGPLTPEQAYMLGKALSMVAKRQGISD